METYETQIQTALKNVEEVPQEKDMITLSTGVVLKFKKIPILRVQAVVEQFPYPDVPEVYNKDKGKYEKNPFSEEYAKMCQQVDQRRGLAVIDTVLAVGTEVVFIPEGFSKPDDDKWIEELKVGHITFDKTSDVIRYHAWAKYVAIVDEEDVGKILEQFGLQLGTSEAGVAQQLHTNFQS